jgi:hypothetical protein
VQPVLATAWRVRHRLQGSKQRGRGGYSRVTRLKTTRQER